VGDGVRSWPALALAQATAAIQRAFDTEFDGLHMANVTSK
jgi:hypothetical protein